MDNSYLNYEIERTLLKENWSLPHWDQQYISAYSINDGDEDKKGEGTKKYVIKQRLN